MTYHMIFLNFSTKSCDISHDWSQHPTSDTRCSSLNHRHDYRIRMTSYLRRWVNFLFGKYPYLKTPELKRLKDTVTWPWQLAKVVATLYLLNFFSVKALTQSCWTCKSESWKQTSVMYSSMHTMPTPALSSVTSWTLSLPSMACTANLGGVMDWIVS